MLPYCGRGRERGQNTSLTIEARNADMPKVQRIQKIRRADCDPLGPSLAVNGGPAEAEAAEPAAAIRGVAVLLNGCCTVCSGAFELLV